MVCSSRSFCPYRRNFYFKIIVFQRRSVCSPSSYSLSFEAVCVFCSATILNVDRDLAEPRRSGNSLNTGRSTVLAVAFTQPFEVSKAKGFQGMVDASPLSLAFAKQGVRINTRGGDHPDGNTDKNGGDDNDDDAD